MKKLVVVVSALIISVVLFGIGFYAGDYFSDYDVLCSKDYTPHKLTKDFRSQEGIIIPQNTIVYLRECKPNTDVRLEFYIDKWDYQNYKPLEKNLFPAYYLETDSDENEQ